MDPAPIDLNDAFLRWVTTLGVGGVLAAFMFYFYRKDVRQYTELWKAQSEALMQVVKENTQAHTENTVLMKALHRRLDADEDERA